MGITKFFATQLRKPSGLFGRLVMVRLLNLLNMPMNRLVLKILQLQPDDYVLEVGFGGGYLIAQMARIVTRGHITGVDFSIDALEACKKRFDTFIKTGTIELQCANVDALPFDANTFTKACTVNTIYFWHDPIVALSQIHRVLKKDGTLLVCFRSRATMEKQEITRHGFRLFEPEEVKSLLSAAGFRDVQIIFGRDRYGECVVAVGKN